MMRRSGVLLASAVVFLESCAVLAQTTAGTSATIVVPVIAQTASFGSEITVYNPNPGAINVTATFYDAQNTAAPGPKSCTTLSLPANVSRQFSVAAQCALPTGSNFGLLVLAETTGTQRFYGYARTQTPQGVGFSTEGFPVENFNDQIQHATGLKRVAASGGLPAYQTNCFVATLGDAVSYELRLFDGGTNVQLGATLTGSLQPFQQFRYLDVFGAAGVASGNKTNVRAQFTNFTANKKKLIGFCTVQENTQFSADFRIAKSYGGTPANAFVQGGNAFGTTAMLGTTDNRPLTLVANNQPVARFVPNATSPNVVSGHSTNAVDPAHAGQTIAGGGKDGSTCYDPVTNTLTSPCANQTSADSATIGGGWGNRAGPESTVGGGNGNAASGTGSTVGGGFGNLTAGFNFYDTVSGGLKNIASGGVSTVTGGQMNTASGSAATVTGGSDNVASGFRATVAGGELNTASGTESFAAGHDAHADLPECAIFGLWSSSTPMNCIGSSNIFRIGANHGFSVEYFSQRADGGGNRWVLLGDIFANQTIATWTGAFLSDGGVWTNASDRNQKENFAPVDARDILARVVALPVTQWSYRSEPGIRRIGPVAQDFHAAFGLGSNDTTIATGDESGVALAAIQGLHQLVQEKDARIQMQQREINDLRQRMTRVETLRGELDAMKRALAQLTGDSRVAALAGP